MLRGVSLGGGTAFTGSIAATQVAFGSGANAFTGSPNFTYDSTNIILSVGSGTTTSAGVQMAYSGMSGQGGLYRTGITPSNSNAQILFDTTNNLTIISSPSNNGQIFLYPQNSSNGLNGVALSGGAFYSAVDGQVSVGKAANRFSSAFLGDTGLSLGFTNTATVGAVTINKSSGRIIIAAGQQTVVLTNSISTAASHVMLNIASATVDTTATSVQGDCSTPGQVTVRLNAPCTAQRLVDFVVFSSN